MRFATIGTNFITDTFMAAAARSEGFELAAVYSRSAEKAAAFAQKYGAPRWFNSLEELAACEQVDAVYIASPNALHCEQSLQMLRAGKHVLCEKPAASNSAELEQMIEQSHRSGRLWLEAMRPAFFPSRAELKQRLAEIAPLRTASLYACNYSSRYDSFKSGCHENIFDPEFSAGALMDMGVYAVHVMVHLFGEPDSLSAHAVKFKNGIDGSGTITAFYGGMIANAVYSKISNGKLPLEIQGENGTITVDSVFRQDRMLLHRRDGSECDFSVFVDEHDMRYEIERFIALADGGDASSYHNDSLIAMRVLDEARRQIGLRFPADAR